MTDTYYRENVLPKVASEINDQCPNTSTSRTMVLHDNAKSHKTGAVTQYLKYNKFTSLSHSAYSPDLVPCDIWLFPRLEEILAGPKSTHIQDLSRAVFSVLRGIPKEEFSSTFQQRLNCA